MLFETSGCANCHTAGNEKRETARTAVNGRAGCLSDAENRGNAPLFELSDPQRRALAAAIESTHSARAHDTPADFAERQVRSLNCVACHTLDVLPDTWSSLKSEIEAVQGTAARDDLVGDQSRPSLTWAGERLRGDWMSRFIAGQVEEKPRPWLAARMPSFGALRGKLLAEGLAQQHGILAPGEPESPVDNELARVGQRLAGKEKGFSCVTCHAVGTASAISPFEAYGPNFAQTARRMRHDFYTRWVRNPQRYEPGTRMPQYADLEGKTSFRDVFEGDAVKQFEAIWQYLRTGEKIEPPR
jgi:mono/diheme cytochrome c family protein